MLSADNIVQIFNQYQNIAIIISILISIGISLVGILPSIFVTGANIIFFGPYIGWLISLLGEVIGGYITFKLYRIGFKKKIELFEGKYKLLNKIVKSSGSKAGLLIFEGRLLPFLPSGLITFAASISNVSDFYFTIATLLGKIPSISLEVLVSYDIINIKDNYYRLGFTIILIIITMITLKFKNKTDR